MTLEAKATNSTALSYLLWLFIIVIMCYFLNSFFDELSSLLL